MTNERSFGERIERTDRAIGEMQKRVIMIRDDLTDQIEEFSEGSPTEGEFGVRYLDLVGMNEELDRANSLLSSMMQHKMLLEHRRRNIARMN